MCITSIHETYTYPYSHVLQNAHIFVPPSHSITLTPSPQGSNRELFLSVCPYAHLSVYMTRPAASARPSTTAANSAVDRVAPLDREEVVVAAAAAEDELEAGLLVVVECEVEVEEVKMTDVVDLTDEP